MQDLFLYIQRKVRDLRQLQEHGPVLDCADGLPPGARSAASSSPGSSMRSLTFKRIAPQVVGKPTTESDYSAEAVFGRNGLDKIVNALSADQRETLRLHFFEGYTLARGRARNWDSRSATYGITTIERSIGCARKYSQMIGRPTAGCAK